MEQQALADQRRQHAQALADALQDIVATLAGNAEVERVILFGSYADGRCDLLTDLDLLIVMHSALDFVTRTAEMYRTLSCPVDVDLLVYTPEELERNRNRAFLRQVLEKGTTVYEKQPA